MVRNVEVVEGTKATTFDAKRSFETRIPKRSLGTRNRGRNIQRVKLRAVIWGLRMGWGKFNGLNFERWWSPPIGYRCSGRDQGSDAHHGEILGCGVRPDGIQCVLAK